MASFRQQVQNNSVALISLVIAVSSLGYNTWRNETTERQRNLRHASFRVLESLGEMQQSVDYRHYYLPYADSRLRESETRLRGYGNLALVQDLMNLMPGPAPEAGRELAALWHMHINLLDDLDAAGQHTEQAREAERELSEAIEHTREAVVDVLHSLE